jgi:hypothetical protein
MSLCGQVEMMDPPIREKAIEVAAAAPASQEWRDRRSIGMFNRRAHPRPKISPRSDPVRDRLRDAMLAGSGWSCAWSPLFVSDPLWRHPEMDHGCASELPVPDA